MLLDIIIEFHAWAAGRPVYEHENTTALLEKGINSIISREKDQGKKSYVGTRTDTRRKYHFPPSFADAFG